MSLLRLIPTDPLSRLRLSVALLMLAVLAPALFRIWCIKGLFRAIRIDGGSMAETLCGDHFRVSCGDCGITFRCDADAFPTDRLAVCPNCGFRDNELRDDDIHRGDRVLVDIWPYLWSAPKRGDLVMLVEPKASEMQGETTFAVKRVAALPSERPGTRDGDVLADGRAIPKSLSELRQVSILVHDDNYRPRKLTATQRWLPSTSIASNWQAIEGGFRFVASADREEAEWLSYGHWHGSASPANRTLATPILDNDSYNQADTRGLNHVRDLLFRCRVHGDGGDFMVAMQDPPHKFILHIQLESRRFLVLKNGSKIIAGNLPESAKVFVLEVALCDGRFLFAQNRHVLAEFPYDEMPVPQNKETASEAKSRLQFGAYGGPLEISGLQVWRDVFHLTPNRLGGEWQAEARLAKDHFFLLGDNSPVSIDSRHWPDGGVPRDTILGKVVSIRR